MIKLLLVFAQRLSSGAAEAKRRELGLEAEGRPQQSAATTGYKCLSIMVIYSIKRSVQTSGDVMIILKRPFGLPIDESSAFFR